MTREKSYLAVKQLKIFHDIKPRTLLLLPRYIMHARHYGILVCREDRPCCGVGLEDESLLLPWVLRRRRLQLHLLLDRLEEVC